MFILYLRVISRITRCLIITKLTLVTLGTVTVERPKCVDTLSSISTLVLVALIYILVTSAKAQTSK